MRACCAGCAVVGAERDITTGFGADLAVRGEECAPRTTESAPNPRCPRERREPPTRQRGSGSRAEAGYWPEYVSTLMTSTEISLPLGAVYEPLSPSLRPRMAAPRGEASL